MLVHGLFGHPKNTWTLNRDLGSHGGQDNDQSNAEFLEPPLKKQRNDGKELFREVFWPRDLLPEVLPLSRIMTWGYDVQIERLLSSTSKASIFHHAETLLSDLDIVRTTREQKQTPIIFIAHSLGGIVVKDALSLSRNEGPLFQDILPVTKGVMFLGTPHHGSRIATLGKVAFDLSRLFFKDPNTKILGALETNSEILERISRSFGQVLTSGRIQVHSFREELDTKGVTIVDAHSATIGYLHETRGSLYANHRNMAKFPSADDINFRRVAAVLRRWIGQVHDVHHRQQLSIPLDSDFHRLPDELVFDQFYQTCLDSLNVPDARRRFEEVESPYCQTYDWLFGNDLSFTSWLKGQLSHPIFWIQGKPGSGKSTVMKYAVGHPKTRMLLAEFNKSTWRIASYFFHDRGSSVQKSIEGLTREILYQILLQDRSIFTSLFHFFERQCIEETVVAPTSTNTSSNVQRRRVLAPWTLHSMRNALFQIRENVKFDMSICLFIDALDEHDGDQRELVFALGLLKQLAQNPSFKLRICLASRPENIFKEEFKDCPGFAIHEHTVNDIRLYTQRSMQTALDRGSLSKDGVNSLQLLSENVIKKAQGVFLWVKLVIEELIEGLREGDSFEELDDLLDSIPTELSELYTRALRRNRRNSLIASTKSKEEAYIMFQIASSWFSPFDIYQFLSASLFLLTGRSSYPELQRLSAQQLRHRLYSRSAGLLEALDFRNVTVHVQFIHQTVKEYMIAGEGRQIIQDWMPESRRESGNKLIFRYLLYLIKSFKSGSLDYEDQKLVFENFSFYTQKLESEEGYCVGPEFETHLWKLSDDEQLTLLTGVDLQALTGELKGCLRSRVCLLLFYLLCGLPLSFSRSLQSLKDELTEGEALKLFELALSVEETDSYVTCKALIQATIQDQISIGKWASLKDSRKIRIPAV